MRRACWIAVLGAAICVSCGGNHATSGPVERVRAAQLNFEVEVSGEIQSVKATPLPVPGQQWTRRQPVWLVSDGAHVETGDVVARFSPEQSELELSQFMIDIQRDALSRIGKQVELGGSEAHVDTDLVDVATRLTIAHRYADANLAEYFSRNEILDAVDDVHFLDQRKSILVWKRGQFAKRGAAEMAVLDAQRATHEKNAAVRQADLAALELHAPHAGVVMLAADWSGEKPRVGSIMMAGQVLAYLPDFTALEIELKVPEVEAQVLGNGQRVRLHPLGDSEHWLETRLSSVATTSQARNKENPAPYLTARAPIPPESVRSLALTPGMRMSGEIEVLKVEKGVSVPNIAIAGEGRRSVVYVRTSHGPEPRLIGLGVHGVSRSQVLSGLKDGEEVLLTPPRASGTSATADTGRH